jgi:hypothetical protein
MSELKEVTDEIIGFQGNKIFRTVKYLSIRPGQVISEYCKGEKFKYLSPVVYFFGVAGILYYLNSITGFADAASRYAAGNYTRILASRGFDVTTDNIRNTLFPILSNETLGILISLPLALLFTWLLFRKYNRSFKDNSWFALYTAGHSTLIKLLIPIYWSVKSDSEFIPVLGSLFQVITSVYVIWAAMQYYQIKPGRAILLVCILKILGILFMQLIIYAVLILTLSFS